MDPSTADGVLGDILGVLKDAMDDGDFNNIEQGVVRVSFTTIDSEIDQVQVDNAPQESSLSDENQERGVRMGLAVSAVGVLLIVLVASVYRRRNQQIAGT